MDGKEKNLFVMGLWAWREKLGFYVRFPNS